MKQDSPPPWQNRLVDCAIVFVVVLGACLFGILTRPVGFLAAFWPANAILLGVFVRFPRLASPAGWISAILAYYAADLFTGGDIVLTTWLTAANVAGVATGVVLFRQVSEDDRRLRRPLSVLYLFCILVAAAAASAVVGAGTAPLYFGEDLVSGAAYWLSTELTNGIIVLPVVLTAPPQLWPMPHHRRTRDSLALAWSAAPAIALAASILVGFIIGGPGALAFPLPALLWCALSYPLFPTVLLTMLVSIWHLMAVSLGWFSDSHAGLDAPTMSGRLGIMLMALGPLTVASINAARNQLLTRLEALATFDTLTGALARGAFLQRSSALISDAARAAPCAVLMLDIDRFKEINDTHGHAAGDKVLTTIAGVVRGSLRSHDLFGRVGGEEFAIILPQTPIQDAVMVAERLRSNIEALEVEGVAPTPLKVTVSIGVAYQPTPGHQLLDALLSIADRALYAAKAGGRNRVVSADF